MNLHRLHKTSADIRVERQLVCLCREIYGGASLGPVSSVIYIKGKRGRIFDPYKRDSDFVLDWMVTKHKAEFLKLVEQYNVDFQNIGFKRTVINRALEIALYLDRQPSYKDIEITYPAQEPDEYYPFWFYCNAYNLQRFTANPIHYLALTVVNNNEKFRYLKQALDSALNNLSATRSDAEYRGRVFGVLSLRRVFDEDTGAPRPEYTICTLSYYETKQKKIHDLSPKAIYAVDAAVKIGTALAEAGVVL